MPPPAFYLRNWPYEKHTLSYGSWVSFGPVHRSPIGANMTDKTLQIMRQRRGLDSGDTSEDTEIKAYTPELVVRELVAWEFGSPSWAGWFAKRVVEAGADIKNLAEG